MKSTIVSPRRVASRFRFDNNRESVALREETAFIFTTSSPLLDGRDCGVYGCPVVTLTGFVKVEGSNHLNSVRRLDGLGGYIIGRVVEVTKAELARLDQFAEATGDYHRFQTLVRGPATGMDFTVWVYQLREDAGPYELAHSAVLEVEAELVAIKGT